VKLIGLIGGLSWESSAAYYALLNREAQKRLGGVHSARSLMASLDFGKVEKLQAAGDWDGAIAMVVEAAKSLEAGGADLLVICSNTMSIASDAVAAACNAPLLHIADATAAPILAAGHRTVGLLGTQFTMEMGFLKDRLAAQGLDIRIPEPDDRAIVHRVIYDELIKGIVTPASRDAYLGVIDRLAAAGAEAVILGCTEIGLLIDQSMTAIPLFDTMALHAIAALDRAMESDQ
jgi:aspartate racemase